MTVADQIALKWSSYIPHDPTRNPKQLAFLVCDALEAMYGGAAGGGKSDALLMAALQYVDVPGYSALCLRRTYPELTKADGLIPRSHEWLGGTDAVWNEQKRTWTFPAEPGKQPAKLEFGHIQRSNDVYQYHSAAYHYIGWDELTTFEEGMYRYLFSRLRRLSKTEESGAIPLRVRAASNPGGVGHDWVLARFIRPGGAGRVFIPATLEDNPFLDTAEYERSLAELDPITRLQLRRGDWSARHEGAMFQREWFKIVADAPKGSRRIRWWDLAATELKKGKDPDWTVGALVTMVEGRWYVIDIKRVRATPGVVESLIKQTASEDGTSTSIWMEQEPGASGVTVIDHYQRKALVGYEFHGFKSTGNKLDRARPLSSAAEAGNVGLVSAPWNGTFRDELEQVPFGSHDDQMDAVSGAMSQLKPQVGYADFVEGLKSQDDRSASGFLERIRDSHQRGREDSPLTEMF